MSKRNNSKFFDKSDNFYDVEFRGKKRGKPHRNSKNRQDKEVFLNYSASDRSR